MKKYLHNSIWFGSLYMGIAFFLLYTGIHRNTYLEGTICRLDYGVFFMKPLQYTLLLVIPLIFNTYLMNRHNFSYSFIIRYESWKQLCFWQIKKSMIHSFFYAAFFVVLVCLVDRKIPIYNWNMQNSYYFSKAHQILQLPLIEVILYLFLFCGIRNFIIESILLFFMWKNSFLQGMICVCGLSCLEIAQKKYQILFRLISFDYTIWIDQTSRVRMLIGIAFYFLIGYVLFEYYINKKEIIE